MKSYKKLMLLVVVAALHCSCQDAFLERAPLDKLNDGHFWKSANDLKVYVNNLYNQNDLLPTYRGWTTPPFYYDGYDGSDVMISIDYNRRTNGENTLPSSGGGWTKDDWATLRNINYFIDNCRKSTEPLEVVNAYAGEVLFFRSIFYYDKLRQFGALPWVSHVLFPTDNKVLFSERAPRNEVVDNLMTDLDNAVAWLPARGSGSWTGRVTKEAALALQARIALFEGTWEKYHALKSTDFKVTGQDGSRFIQKAADAADELMKLSKRNGYPALDNVGDVDGYRELFMQKDYSRSSEVILWRKYSVEDKLTHYWLNSTSNGGGFGLTKSMIDSYLCDDGKPVSVSSKYQGDNTLADVIKNRDPRLRQTIYVDDNKHYIWTSPEQKFFTPVFEGTSSDNCPTGYQLYKGHSADYAASIAGGTSAMIYFRYAETLLIYAEAKAELGTITQADVELTINALRQRVGMTDAMLDMGNITVDPNWEFSGISPILQEIRRERKVELIAEGFRRDDIFRWAAANELLRDKRPLGAKKQQWVNYSGASEAFKNAAKALDANAQGYIDPLIKYPNMNNGYQFDLGRDYLLPIPTDQIVLNPKLGQNPGW